MRILWHMPILRRRGCGLSNRALRFAAALRKSGHAVSFVVAANKTDIDGDLIDEMPLEKITVAPVRQWHWSLQALRRRRMADRIAQCLDHDHDLFVSCQPEMVRAYLRLHSRRRIMFVCGGTTLLHESVEATRHSFANPLSSLSLALDRCLKHRNEAAGFAAADLAVFDSHQTRRRVMDRYGVKSDKCFTVYGGVDPSIHRPPSVEERREARLRLAIDSNALVLVWTGRLSPEKNLSLLIRALPRCPRRPERLFLVGDGPMRAQLKTLCDEQGVTDIVTFTGEVADVRPYLYAADVFVFPSKGESFGGSLVEAMACGLPCIALRSDGRTVRNACEEILGEENCGVLARADEPAALAEAMDDLAADPVCRHRLGRLAALRARETFSWTQGGRKLNELVTGLFTNQCTAPTPTISTRAETSSALQAG